MLKLFSFEMKKIHRSAVLWVCLAGFAIVAILQGLNTVSTFNNKDYLKDVNDALLTDEQVTAHLSEMDTEEEKQEYMENVEWQRMVRDGATEEQLSKMSESDRRVYEAARSGEAYFLNKEDAEFYTDNDINTGYGIPTLMENAFSSSTFLIIFLAFVVSTVMAREYSQGTIKMSLISPHRRSEIISAKIITICAIIIEFMVITAFLCAITGVLFFMIKGIPNPEPFNSLKAATIGGVLSPINTSLRLLVMFGIGVLEVFMFGMFTFMISIITKSIPITIFAPIIFNFTSSIVGTNDTLRNSKVWSMLFFNLKNNYLIWGASATSKTALWTALLATAIWAILFMGVSAVIFERQDVYN